MVQKSANFVLFSKLPPKATMLKNLTIIFLKRKIEEGLKKNHTPSTGNNQTPNCYAFYVTQLGYIFFSFLIQKSVKPWRCLLPGHMATFSLLGDCR